MSTTFVVGLVASMRWASSSPFMIGIRSVADEQAGGVNGTRYTALCRHWTEEDRIRHEEMGFAEGWGACADQLKVLYEAA